MRHTLAYVLTAAFITVGSTGCVIYFGDGDGDDDDCLYGGGGGGAAEPAPLPGLRNPVTGQCEYYGGGGGGGGGCDPACGVCEPMPTDPAPGALPSWGFCESQCSYLDEATCLATSGCRAAYMDGLGFYECWSVDMSGPVQGGQCAGLDAWECSRHDDCVALHTNNCSAPIDPADPNSGDIACGISDFRECAPEPGADPGQCWGEVLCDALPPACPPDSVAGQRDGCWTGACIPVTDCEPMPCGMIADEQACVDRVDCDALYEGSDCTCDASGNCTCNIWTFTSCTTADPTLPPSP